jgi:hypothetical protein
MELKKLIKVIIRLIEMMMDHILYLECPINQEYSRKGDKCREYAKLSFSPSGEIDTRNASLAF